jgi:Lar family restriction alleviation protein
MAKTKPLPCPFCGGTRLQLLHRDWGWWFVCKKCDALGPLVKGKDEMVATWNRRAEAKHNPTGDKIARAVFTKYKKGAVSNGN